MLFLDFFGVADIWLLFAVLGAELDFLLACGIVVDRLNNKLICGDQVGHHLLEAGQSQVRVSDRCPIEVRLVSTGGLRHHALVMLILLHLVVIVALHLVVHAVVAEVRQHGHRHEVWVVPQALLLLLLVRLLVSNIVASVPLLAFRGRNLVRHA